MAASSRRQRAPRSAGWAAAVLCGALLAVGCTTPGAPPRPVATSAAPQAVRAALAPTGTLRVAVYRGSPSSYIEGDGSRPTRGVAHDLGQAMAARLGVSFQAVVFPRNDDALRAAHDGHADLVFTNASPERRKLFHFSPTVLTVDKGVLVPAGSPLTSVDALRVGGQRIGVSTGSSTGRELPALFPLVVVVETPSLQAAAGMIATRQIDGFSSNKAILHELADRVPGAVVLPGSTGTESFALGVPPGRDTPDAAAWLHRFASDVVRDGVVAGAVQRSGLRGVKPAE